MERKQYFRDTVLSLLTIEDYPTFHRTVLDLVAEFSLLGSWFKWYLNLRVARHLFKACRSLNSDQEKAFSRMKRDTNAQEGLGGLLQFLHDRRQDGLFYVLQTIFAQVKMSDAKTLLGLCGVKVTYTASTPKEKKQGGERKSGYKGPESENSLWPGSKKRVSPPVLLNLVCT